MEKIDIWKKYPSLLIGEPLSCAVFSADSVFAISASKQLFQPELLNRFIFIHQPLPAALLTSRELIQNGYSQHQIIFLLDSNLKCEISETDKRIIFLFPEESKEELKGRIQVQLEIIRQETLQYELERFPELDDPSVHQRSIARARLVHALAASLSLAPGKHASCIKTALSYEEKNVHNPTSTWVGGQIGTPWAANSPLELVLVDICELALRNQQNSKFRQNYRMAAANLPFTYRSDLKNAVELCFQHLWEDLKNVA